LLLLLFAARAPPTPETYTLSLHDALPIWFADCVPRRAGARRGAARAGRALAADDDLRRGPGTQSRARHLRRRLRERRCGRRPPRSEEHTSELQSLAYLVCRLLLEKKKILN